MSTLSLLLACTTRVATAPPPPADPPADDPPQDTDPIQDVWDTDVVRETGIIEHPDADPGAPLSVVRFIALGDAGEGNTEQYTVAQAIADVCAQRGCDLAVYLGDNFYDDGVDSVHDEQFDTKFELPYADLDFPFYVTLGNHDFGEIPVQFWKTDYQVEYTAHSDKWHLPDHFYDEAVEHALFVSLDTNMIMLGLDWTQNQRAWVRQRLRRSAATWRIGFGHHPFKSNGEHGNAGNYEGAWYDVTGIVRGDNVLDFMRDTMCGNFDLYLSGHDHNLQWLEPRCGMELIVAGAGAKTTDFVRRDNNPTRFEHDSSPGFVWIELVGDTMTAAFYDLHGNALYEGTSTRRP